MTLQPDYAQAMRNLMFAAAVLLTACSTAKIPPTNTPDEILAYVNRAADVVARDGLGACETFKRTDWHSGDWYIFMLDATGRTVCHPARPEQVGAMAADLSDANGMRFGNEFMRIAADGGGWVAYMWSRPGQDVAVAKRSYVRQVTAPDGQVFVIGSGGYDLP